MFWPEGKDWKPTIVQYIPRFQHLQLFVCLGVNFFLFYLHCICNGKSTKRNFALKLPDHYGGSSGRVWRVRSPTPYQTCFFFLPLVWHWNSCIHRNVYPYSTSWFFLMKRTLHVVTKLNAQHFQKCNNFLNLCYQAQEEDVQRVRPLGAK